jgi:C4-dicarboxylate transporter/malic acid transport protein
MTGKNVNIIKYFSPAWFAMIMGTGGLANVLHTFGKVLPAANAVAVFLWLLNSLLFVLLLFPWLTRWLAYKEQVIADLKHPLTTSFFITMPAGCIILGSNFLLIGQPYLSPAFLNYLGLALYIVGAVLALTFAVTGFFNLVSSEEIGPEPINFAWLMMPAVNIVIPLLGNLLVKTLVSLNEYDAQIINLLDIAFYGIGIILFFIMATIVFNRLIMHRLPPAMAAPTFWVLLGPIGVGTVSLFGLADASQTLGILTNVDGIKFGGLILWGFGLWAFIFALSLTIKYLKTEGIPFSLSWLAFLFPLAAYTLATLMVYDYSKIKLLMGYSIILSLLLAVMWIVTFTRTLFAYLNGELFNPPSIPKI